MTLYLVGYFGLGVVTLLLLHLRAKAKADSSEEELFNYLHVEDSWWEKTLIPLIVYPLLLLLWPVLIVWKIKETLYPPKTIADLEHKEFSVKQKHLLQQITSDEIERVAMVDDPLGAAPKTPFGHLNSVWLKYKESLGSEDTLWTFAADYTDEWDIKQYKEGYVAVSDDGIGPYFLTSRRFKGE